MRIIRDDQMHADVDIDGKRYVLESATDYDFVIKRAEKYKGVSLLRDRVDIIMGIWSQLEEDAQKKFERSKLVKDMGLKPRFEAMRARGAG